MTEKKRLKALRRHKAIAKKRNEKRNKPKSRV